MTVRPVRAAPGHLAVSCPCPLRNPPRTKPPPGKGFGRFLRVGEQPGKKPAVRVWYMCCPVGIPFSFSDRASGASLAFGSWCSRWVDDHRRQSPATKSTTRKCEIWPGRPTGSCQRGGTRATGRRPPGLPGGLDRFPAALQRSIRLLVGWSGSGIRSRGGQAPHSIPSIVGPSGR